MTNILYDYNYSGPPIDLENWRKLFRFVLMLAIIQITLYLFGTYLETGRQEKTFFDTTVRSLRHFLELNFFLRLNCLQCVGGLTMY